MPAVEPKVAREAEVTRLKGPAGRVVTNMETSLEIPTATSVFPMPVSSAMTPRSLSRCTRILASARSCRRS